VIAAIAETMAPAMASETKAVVARQQQQKQKQRCEGDGNRGICGGNIEAAVTAAKNKQWWQR